jgi:hypothetical protein
MRTQSYAGVDLGRHEHALCVVDADGEILGEGPYPHSEVGIGGLIARLDGLGARCVATEQHEGLLVDRLVQAGLAVIPVDPRAVKACRRRYSGTGRKSDAFDAFCLAQLGRTDHHLHRPLVPDREETRALRALTRAREDLLIHKTAVLRLLQEQLESYWPGPRMIFADLASPVALAFLHRYPSPRDAHGLKEADLAAFLKERSSRIRRPAAVVLAELRAAPGPVMGPAELEGRALTMLGLLAQLEVDVREIDRLTTAIVAATRAHPDGQIFLSPFKGTRLTTPALLIVGFGDDRGRYPNAAALAVRAGVAPASGQTGARGDALFRRSCDVRLRQAFASLADATRRHDPWARELYSASRERGHRHPHALRVLGRAWLRVLWRCWQDGVPYDPERHGAMRRLKAAAGAGG